MHMRPEISRPKVLRQNARLLRFGAGIDLDIKAGVARGFLNFRGERLGDLFAVHRLDHVEKEDRVMRFIGLQRADEMQFEARMVRLE